MKPNNQQAPNAVTEPRVKRIHVEYADGTCDDIEHLPQDETAFYDLRRKGPDSRKRSLGLHTSGAVASILFLTAFYGRRRKYSVGDAEVSKLLDAFTK